MSSSQKISQFAVQPSLVDSDLVTIVRNGQNFNITYADLKASLGVTGSLSSIGDTFGTPILNQPTPETNEIRKLETAKGVSASISAQGGVLIHNSFVNGTVGAKIIQDLSAGQYTFRSIAAGSGINVSESGDKIQISLSSTPISSKTVIVSSVSDFPAQVGGVITLDSDTDYFLVNDITTSNRFVVNSSNTIRAASSQIVKLTYTGSATMFSGNGANFKIEGLTLAAPTATLFNFTNAIPSGVFQIVDSNIESCDVIGSLNNMFIARFSNIGWEDIKTNGISFSGTNLNVILDTSVIFLNGGTFLDLGSALFSELSIEKQSIQQTSLATAKFMTGLASSGNIISGGICDIRGCRVSALTNPLTGITTNDNRYEFLGNSGLSNSINDALTYVSGSTAETVITTAGVKVKVNNVFTDDTLSRFTSDGAGRLTYIGERSARLPIDVSANVLAAAGGDKQITICIAINGVVLDQTCSTGTASSSKAASVPTMWQHEFKTNDYVEIFVTNETDTTNVIVQQAVMRIN